VNPLSVVRNDYHKNKKNSTVYTPVGVARFLFDILHEPIQRTSINAQLRVFDPAIGSGRLTDPWFDAGHSIIGCDINPDTGKHSFCSIGRFEDFTWWLDGGGPELVLCNPPFNGATGKRLYPEVFLERIFELFGVKMPVALFVPMGFLLNQRRKSKRWRWLRDCGAEITSIVSLPLDIFPDVEFHNEILIYNVSGINPHYFLPEELL
jgi:type I restriction enzyme M protein